jgi:hypothetical protein
VLNCASGYVELRDRRGAAFARDELEKRHLCGLKARILMPREASGTEILWE